MGEAMATRGSGPTVRRRRLGSELRRYRTAAGKTLEDAAEVLECHSSRVSRIETGHLSLKRRDVMDLLDLYGVDDSDVRTTLATLAREKSQPNWWESFGLDPLYADLLGLESESNYIRMFQSILVPGLLQTRDYTRAVVRANPALVSDEAVENLLEVRDERKKILTRDEDPVRFWAIVGESALRTPVGGRDVMAKQLEHLEAVTEKPNVTLQVLPHAVGAHAGMSGPFVIYAFPLPGESEIVFLENLTSSLYLETREEIDEYTLVFDVLRSSALNPADSLALIGEIKKQS